MIATNRKSNCVKRAIFQIRETYCLSSSDKSRVAPIANALISTQRASPIKRFEATTSRNHFDLGQTDKA